MILQCIAMFEQHVGRQGRTVLIRRLMVNQVAEPGVLLQPSMAGRFPVRLGHAGADVCYGGGNLTPAILNNILAHGNNAAFPILRLRSRTSSMESRAIGWNHPACGLRESLSASVALAINGPSADDAPLPWHDTLKPGSGKQRPERDHLCRIALGQGLAIPRGRSIQPSRSGYAAIHRWAC